MARYTRRKRERRQAALDQKTREKKLRALESLLHNEWREHIAVTRGDLTRQPGEVTRE